MKETPKLMLPLQSAPVDRTLGVAALSEGLGVEASQSAGQIVDNRSRNRFSRRCSPSS